MAINQDKTWEEVGNTKTGDNGRVRDAFKNGTAKKVLLEPTFKSYKFNEYKTLAAPESTSVSPWWSPYEAYVSNPVLSGGPASGNLGQFSPIGQASSAHLSLSVSKPMLYHCRVSDPE